MPKPTHQKTAFITGGAKRIGRAITTALHSAGFQVIIHCHQSRDAADSLAFELNAIRIDSAHVVQADLAVVNDTHDLSAFIDSVLNAFSDDAGRLDLLVHNASSFYATPMDSSHATMLNHWEDLMLTNTKAPWLLTHALLDTLKASGGSVVSLLDIHADNKPFPNHPIYSMAKAAQRMMVQALALELAPCVRINGVAPGVNIFPEQTISGSIKGSWQDVTVQQSLLASVPLARNGTPEDIAAAVLFLSQASYITGQIIAVDGGRSLTLKGG